MGVDQGAALAAAWRALPTAALLLVLVPRVALAQPGGQAVGQALAQGRSKFVQCATCHGGDGRSSVVPQYPKIGGQNAGYVVNALKAYRDGRRQGTFASLMTAVAKSLSDTDIEQLALYVESLGAGCR